jgi:hypothetical protein
MYIFPSRKWRGETTGNRLWNIILPYRYSVNRTFLISSGLYIAMQVYVRQSSSSWSSPSSSSSFSIPVLGLVAFYGPPPSWRLESKLSFLLAGC